MLHQCHRVFSNTNTRSKFGARIPGYDCYIRRKQLLGYLGPCQAESVHRSIPIAEEQDILRKYGDVASKYNELTNEYSYE